MQFQVDRPAREVVSPSSRRAWIEITVYGWVNAADVVALLAEGVDRNWTNARYGTTASPSPSSRRAWIEIRLSTNTVKTKTSPSSRRAWIEITKSA